MRSVSVLAWLLKVVVPFLLCRRLGILGLCHHLQFATFGLFVGQIIGYIIMCIFIIRTCVDNVCWWGGLCGLFVCSFWGVFFTVGNLAGLVVTGWCRCISLVSSVGCRLCVLL